MWQAIQYVSSGVTLAAFITAVVAWVVKSKLEERERIIRKALAEVPDEGRLEALKETFSSGLSLYQMPQGLTKQQTFELALEDLRAKRERWRLVAIVVCIIAVLGSGVAVYAIGQTRKQTDNSEVRIAGRVRDENGNGLAAALITIPGRGNTESDGRGEFQFTIPPNRVANSYELEISHEGFVATNFTVPGPRPEPVSAVLVALKVPTNSNPANTKLLVEFAYVHVYLDGSPGKDNWSVSGYINGKKIPIWDHKKDISDDCHDQLGPGPGGDSSACQYSLAKVEPVVLKPGETLTVAFDGMANDEHDEIPRSSETFTEVQNWGVGGEGYSIQGKMYRRMGNVNAGQTEYYMYYRIFRP